MEILCCYCHQQTSIHSHHALSLASGWIHASSKLTGFSLLMFTSLNSLYHWTVYYTLPNGLLCSHGLPISTIYLIHNVMVLLCSILVLLGSSSLVDTYDLATHTEIQNYLLYTKPLPEQILTVCEVFWHSPEGNFLANRVWCRYYVVSILTNIHKRHPIAHLLGRGMVCLLWIQGLTDILPQFD